MVANETEFLKIPHLLEWYACYCAATSASCEQPRAERLLRALSVDLALEAEKYRRMVRQTTQLGGQRSERARAVSVDIALRAERYRRMESQPTEPDAPVERPLGAAAHQEIALGA
jgi:hypothetical protein